MLGTWVPTMHLPETRKTLIAHPIAVEALPGTPNFARLLLVEFTPTCPRPREEQRKGNNILGHPSSPILTTLLSLSRISFRRIRMKVEPLVSTTVVLSELDFGSVLIAL